MRTERVQPGPNLGKEYWEPEITPEMVEAGASVLYGMTLAYADEPYWAKEVYRAMELCRGGPKGADTCAGSK